MAKPKLYKILPFDATLGSVVTYYWNGQQQKESEIVIESNDGSNTVIYTGTYTSFVSQHTIPTDSGLTNGKSYRIKVRVKTTSDDYSEYSDYGVFKCFSTPTFEFQDFSTGAEVRASNISIDVVYQQEENEPLNTWIAYLYNRSENILMDTEEQYASNNMHFSFSGLEDEQTYYLRAVGTTVNGMIVDTGMILFTVNYSLPGQFLNVNLTNNPMGGNVHVSSRAVSLTGRAATEPVEYLYQGEVPYAADLSNNFVTFNENLDISKDFSFYMKLSNVRVINRNDYEDVLPLQRSIYSYVDALLDETVRYNAFICLRNISSDLQYYLTLWKTETKNGVEYQVYLYSNSPDKAYGLWSNPLIGTISSTDKLGVLLTRKDEVLSLVLKKFE